MIGPIQLVVVGFGPDADFRGEILAEIRRLREDDVVRLVDLLIVRKDEQGEVGAIQTSDLTDEEAAEFGATVGALIGLGIAGEEGVEAGAIVGAAQALEGGLLDEDDVWYVADAIPNGTIAAVALLEHRWALPLRDKIVRAGGRQLADAWIHPRDLVAVGLLAAEEAEEALGSGA